MSDTPPQGERTGYLLPPEPIPTILDAPPTPVLALSPDRRWLAWLGRRGLPPLAEVAEPELRLAGVRINPRTNSRSRQDHLISLAFGHLDGGEPDPADLPPDPRLTYPLWSPDSRHLAFALTSGEDVGLWVADPRTGRCRRLDLPGLNGAFGHPYRWLPDCSGLLALTVVPGRGDPPPPHPVAEGPIVQESHGRTTPTRTYQDLLDGPYSEQLFEYYFTGVLWTVPLTGDAVQLTPPQLIASFDPAPGGSAILLQRLHRPFSYLVPYNRFPLEVRVLDTDGEEIRAVANLPLAEEIPVAFDAVAPGPRAFQWRSDAPAQLVWVEALDGGDPRNEAKVRDRVVILREIEAEPEILVELEHRYAGIHWGRGDLAIVYSRWWVTRTERRIAIQPDAQGLSRLLVERSYQDAYSDPGWPMTRRTPQGRAILHVHRNGRSIFLAGEGASPRGSFPFLDRFDVETEESTRLWQCAEGEYEQVAAVLDDRGDRLLTRWESQAEPPNYRVRDASDGRTVAITRFPDPAPQLAGLQRRLITYARTDGVNLSATLLTPPGYSSERDGPLPLLVWAYPREFRDAGDAGQVQDSPNRFSRPAGASHLFLLTQGYAILDGPAMPIVGEGDEEPNDSYLQQLVGSAEAAVEAVVGLGVADRRRIAVGGHSYGAFMAANLLAHTSLFRAGVARSGAYNRSLTPFGFQQEQRTYWEAADTYHQMSPFSHADRLRAPILLIHGAEDNNPGTYPLQSERFFHALRGHGATVRYVLLPHESHGYRARESVLHVLAEMIGWLDRWLAGEGS